MFPRPPSRVLAPQYRLIKKAEHICSTLLMAEVTGLEPATFCVTGRRSNQLSYTSKVLCKYLRPAAVFK